MVQATTKRTMKLIDNGSIDWRPVQDNFTNIYGDMAHNAAEITALAQRQTWTIVKMFEDTGVHEIMAANKHLRCKCVSAFATLADSAVEEVEVKFENDKFNFTETEKAGKARAFRLDDFVRYHFVDVIEVEQTGERKVIYTFTFESAEEEQ